MFNVGWGSLDQRAMHLMVLNSGHLGSSSWCVLAIRGVTSNNKGLSKSFYT